MLFRSPLTGGLPPYTRFVNFGFMIASIGAIYLTLAPHANYAREAAVSLLAVPQLWKATGMTLTEIPALFFFSVFMMVFVRPAPSMTAVSCLLRGLLAGASLGVAILGRQTYLVAVAPLVMTAIMHRHLRLQAAATLCTMGFVCGWLFMLWGGLVPPSLQSVDSGLRLRHGLFSFSYLGVASFLIWPHRYLQASKSLVASAVALGLAITLLAGGPNFLPGHGTLLRLLPAPLAHGAAMMCAPLFLGAGSLWVMMLARDLVVSVRSPGTAFILMNTLVLALAPVKVSHLFSSRYIVGTLGAECSRNTDFEPSWLHLVALVCGSLAGAMSLATHYSLNPGPG